MGRDVKDRVAAQHLFGEFVLIIEIAIRRLDRQSGDISPVAPRAN
jgi:hypothetical protein